jgi:phosphoribosylaminoimidazole (AIR) synthetase
MVIAVAAKDADAARHQLESEGETVYLLGQVLHSDTPDAPVEFVS